MASGIACGHVRTTVMTMTQLRKTAAILWQRHALSVCSGRKSFFMVGFLKKNDSEGWSNVFKIGLHWGKKQEARINRQRSSEDRKKEQASAGEGGETVLNNAVNYSESRARERKWNNTEQCCEAELTRAIERRRKYPTNWLRRLQNFTSSKFAWRDAVQLCKKILVTWFGQVMNKRNQMCLSVKRNYKTVNAAEKSGWFADLSKRLLQFSLHNFCCKFLPGRFTLVELNCQLVVSDFCCGVCYEN